MSSLEAREGGRTRAAEQPQSRISAEFDSTANLPCRIGSDGARGKMGAQENKAMVREFREEAGFAFHPIASRVIGEGRIFAGKLGREEGKAEMKWCLFEELPSDLSFPKVEYRELVSWGRRQMGPE
jgi:hypothetical protein